MVVVGVRHTYTQTERDQTRHTIYVVKVKKVLR